MMFASQLNELCAQSGRQITNVALAQALADRNCDVSVPYLSQLRRGHRANPGVKIVEALADYFEVPVEYFFAPIPTNEVVGSVEEDLRTLQRLDSAVLRRLLMCAQNLSPASLEILVDFSSHLRTADMVPPFLADSHIYKATSRSTRVRRKRRV